MYIVNHHYCVNNNIKKAPLALLFSNCESRAEPLVFAANYRFLVGEVRVWKTHTCQVSNLGYFFYFLVFMDNSTLNRATFTD